MFQQAQLGIRFLILFACFQCPPTHLGTSPRHLQGTLCKSSIVQAIVLLLQSFAQDLGTDCTRQPRTAGSFTKKRACLQICECFVRMLHLPHLEEKEDGIFTASVTLRQYLVPLQTAHLIVFSRLVWRNLVAATGDTWQFWVMLQIVCGRSYRCPCMVDSKQYLLQC